MMYLIKNESTVKGVASYIDEAQEFAERFTGWYDTIIWAPNGNMLLRKSGEPTGWKIEKVVSA